MKRFLVILLISILVVAMLCGTATIASAAQNDVELSLKVEKEGEEVVATAILEKNDGVVDLYLRVEYDTDSLELIDSKLLSTLRELGPVDNFGDSYEYPYRVIYAGSGKNSDDTGSLFRLRFKVKEGAPNGDASVRLVVRQVAYLAGDAAAEPIYNTKYGSPISITDIDSTITGGETVAEGRVVITKGSVTRVESSGDPHTDGSKGLMIGLIVGGVVILVGAGVAAYFINRRKRQKSEE